MNCIPFNKLRMKRTNDLFDIKFYSAVFQHLPDPAFIKDQNFRYLLVNKAFCSHYHLRLKDIIGHTDRDFLSPELFKTSRDRERMVLKTGIAAKIEQNHVAPDGICYRILTLNTLFVTPEGKKLIFGMMTDVTDQTQFRQKLRESEKKYKTIFKVIPNPVGIFTYPERIGLDVNAAFVKVGGIPRKTIIGKQGIYGYTWADEEERERYFTSLVRNRKVDNMEARFYISNGKLRTFLISARMVKLEGQTSVIAALQDITRQKNLEHDLISKVIEAEERERQRIATDLHDDLGPMLSSLKLRMEHLRLQKDSADFGQQSDQNVALLNDVISRLHSISMNISPHLIEHYGLEASVRDLCSRIGDSTGTSVSLNSNLHGLRFSSELELHFYRIISELVNNSLKHAQGAAIVIRLYHTENNLRLTFYNKGKTYDTRKILRTSKGMGLQNIIRRVRHMGGSIKFSNVRGRTEVRIICLEKVKKS